MLWVKAFHIIAVVCWFAGIFYLPRLFVYHAMADDQATQEHLSMMEQKLYKFMSMFVVFTFVFGFWLVSYNWQYYAQSNWFYCKLALVITLLIYHLVCGSYIKKLQVNHRQRSHVYFRWFNELPVIILFTVVILVVVKPF